MNAPNQKPPNPLIQQLLWHCLMGITLGIICAGLLLQIGAGDPTGLIAGPVTLVARLRFLLEAAFFFGTGATLTGATFLANEKAGSRNR